MSNNIEKLKQILSESVGREYEIGMYLDKIYTNKEFIYTGHDNFASFVNNVVGINSKTAQRYIYKYKVVETFKDDSIKKWLKKQPVSISERLYIIAKNGGQREIETLYNQYGDFHKLSFKEIVKIYEKYKTQKNRKSTPNRVCVSFTDDEYEEFLEIEQKLVEVFSLETRKDAIMNALRSLYTEAIAAQPDE